MRIGVHQTTRGCRHCRLVGSSGVEPPTSCLSGMRSNLLSYEPVCLASLLDFLCLCFFSAFTTILPIFRSAGGDEGNRTLDPLLAGQVLSQLSYTPIFMGLLTVPENRTTNSSSDFVLVVFLFSLWVREDFHLLTFSIERRWSSRTFRYGYLVTT